MYTTLLFVIAFSCLVLVFRYTDLCGTKVTNFCAVVRREKDVFWLDVVVQDIVGCSKIMILQ